MQDRYGKLRKPERQEHIEVIENPVAVFRAAYRVWLPMAHRADLAVFGDWTLFNPENARLCEQLYQEAVMLLRPSAKPFAAPKPRELEDILATVKPEDAHTAGLFLSALLNATGLPALDGVFQHRILGYRLAPGKTLTIGRNSSIKHLGWHAHGTIINHGTAEHFAHAAKAGLQVNAGTVASDMALSASGGIQVNHGAIGRAMGDGASGGIQISTGRIYRNLGCASGGIQVNTGVIQGETAYDGQLAAAAAGGIQVNRGTVGGSMAEDANEGIRINYGTIRNWNDLILGSRSGVHINRKRPDQQAPVNSPTLNWPLIERLEQRLTELDELATGDWKETLRTYQSRDWNAYAREVLALGKQIEMTSR